MSTTRNVNIFPLIDDDAVFTYVLGNGNFMLRSLCSLEFTQPTEQKKASLVYRYW